MSKLFCKNQLRLHRDRSSYYIDNYDFILSFCKDSLINSIDQINSNFNEIKVLELNSRHGLLSNYLLNKFGDHSVIAAEISEKLLRRNAAMLKLVADEEDLPFNNASFSLIVSFLGMHWVNDVPNYLQRVKRLLKPGGVFLSTFIGGSSLKNFRYNIIKAEESSRKNYPHISPFIEIETINSLLSALEFKDIVTDHDYLEIEYNDVMQLMYDLRYMGEAACFLNSNPYSINKNILANLKKTYPGPFKETIEIINLKVSNFS